MRNWTRQDDNLLVALLKRLPQSWSHETFCALSRAVVTTAIEAVILRRNGDRIEILLTKRDDTDPDWPGELHIPGTILRQTDRSYKDALKRLEDEELKVRFSSIKFVNVLFIETERGKVNEHVYLCTIDGDPPVGKYYDVENLPPNFIKHQQSPLNLALQHFKNEKS